jgi:hypothetical protein
MIYTAQYVVMPSEIEQTGFDLAADITRHIIDHLHRAYRPDAAGPIHVEWVAQCAHPTRNGETVDVPWVPGSSFPLRVRQLVCRGHVETGRPRVTTAGK